MQQTNNFLGQELDLETLKKSLQDLKNAPGATSWALGGFSALGLIVASAFSLKDMKSLLETGEGCKAITFGYWGIGTLLASIFIISMLAYGTYQKSEAEKTLEPLDKNDVERLLELDELGGEVQMKELNQDRVISSLTKL
jgi:hypothetical protein